MGCGKSENVEEGRRWTEGQQPGLYTTAGNGPPHFENSNVSQGEDRAHICNLNSWLRRSPISQTKRLAYWSLDSNFEWIILSFLSPSERASLRFLNSTTGWNFIANSSGRPRQIENFLKWDTPKTYKPSGPSFRQSLLIALALCLTFQPSRT